MSADDPMHRYQVMEALGAGGQGNTYRGVDRVTSEDVAIKIVSLSRLGGWKAFDLFEREVEVLSGLSHPGVPRFICSYASEASGDYFLVMELAEGPPLSKFIGGEASLPAAKVERVFEQVLEILE
jgi:serine/threonine protein kinase